MYRYNDVVVMILKDPLSFRHLKYSWMKLYDIWYLLQNNKEGQDVISWIDKTALVMN